MRKINCPVIVELNCLASGCVMAAAPAVKAEKKSPINIGDTVNRNYKLVNELGRGGFGVVYEVEDKRNRKKYAMKVSLYIVNEFLVGS